MLAGIFAATAVVAIIVAAFVLCKASSDRRDDEWLM